MNNNYTAVSAERAVSTDKKTTTITTRAAVYKLLCMAGEYPMSAIDLLPGATFASKQRAIYRVKESGIVKTNGKKDERSIRLYAKTKGTGSLPKALQTVLDTLGDDYYYHYLWVTNNHHYSGDRDKKLRRLRMAEILAVCCNAGVEIRPWVLPQLSVAKGGGAKTSSTGFYHAKALKYMCRSESKKVPNSRMYGLLISPGGAYVIYNVHKGLITNIAGGEVKAQIFIWDVLLCNWNPPNEIRVKDNAFDGKQAIVFGANLGVAKMLYNDTGRRNKIHGKNLQFDKTYYDVFFIPSNQDGAFILWMMTQRNWRNNLVYGIIRNEYISNDMRRDYDAILSDGRKILIWFDGNISTLSLFKMLGDKDKKQHILLCFPWQETVIRDCVGEGIGIKTYSQGKIESILVKKGAMPFEPRW